MAVQPPFTSARTRRGVGWAPVRDRPDGAGNGAGEGIRGGSMRRRWFAISAICAVMALVAAACNNNTGSGSSGTSSASASLIGTGHTICFVADVGGVNDKSFNQQIYEGLQSAVTDLGITLNYVTSHSGADYAPNIQTLREPGLRPDRAGRVQHGRRPREVGDGQPGPEVRDRRLRHLRLLDRHPTDVTLPTTSPSSRSRRTRRRSWPATSPPA